MALLTVTNLGKCRFPSPIRQTLHGESFVPEAVEWSRPAPPRALKYLEVAGARRRIFFKPSETRAGIVTCGGLCPGLNNVIRSLFLELHFGYGVKEVLGFRDGYRGLDPDRGAPPITITPDLVDDIHGEGGTILGTSRGPVDTGAAVDNLIRLGINMLFTIGGDGTQRGGRDLFVEARRRKHPLAVVGIPKTIDNDVPFVSRTFGFTTAVGAARDVIDCAHTECHSCFNGVSLVKLMGRHAGFIAAAASVASQDVNFCLIPELPFTLDGDRGLLLALKRRLEQRRHAVIVVAEGAGQELMGTALGTCDASGNAVLQDVGPFLKQRIADYFKAQKMEITLRYFDPSYVVRSVAANSEDAVLCDSFARHAAHAAMAGKTGVIIGVVHGHFVHVPIELLKGRTRNVDLKGELWRGVLATTGQPVTWS
ncbi:MAG TPA: ATP-dependent 6-phosphofructokinase [Verrucomicrobiae bacterium]|nr:ATP-dependent 6-phosphofructokinase [Verrucomicrobiae bacterium]